MRHLRRDVQGRGNRRSAPLKRATGPSNTQTLQFWLKISGQKLPGPMHFDYYGGSEACPVVSMCSAWRLGPGNGGSGGVAQLWRWTKKRRLLPNYTSDSNQIWFEVSGHDMGASGACLNFNFCSAWRLDSGEGLKVCFLFWQSLLPNHASDLNHMWY